MNYAPFTIEMALDVVETMRRTKRSFRRSGKRPLGQDAEALWLNTLVNWALIGELK